MKIRTLSTPCCVPQARLPSAPGAGKAPATFAWSQDPMVAIGMIVAFLVVMAALNFYEFGRLD